MVSPPVDLAPDAVPPQVDPKAALPATEGEPSLTPQPRDRTGFVKDKSIEVVAERTERTKTFVNPDRTRTMRTSNRPLHYRNGEDWLPIDPTLVPDVAPNTFRNKANSWTVRLGPLSEGVTITSEAGSFRFAPVGANAVAPELEPATNSVVYREAWPGADLRYRVLSDEVKEDIVLHRRPAGNSFAFTSADTAFVPDPLIPGALRPTGLLGDRLRVSAPEVFAANGAPAPEAAPALVPGADGLLTLQVDQSWLTASQTRTSR